MIRHGLFKFVGIIIICGVLPCEPTRAQAIGEISADEFGKQFAKDRAEFLANHQGRTLRIRGQVAIVLDPIVYLATNSTVSAGQPIMLTLESKPGGMPKLAIGERIVVVGRLSRVGAFGPILTDGRVVQREPEPKATATGPAVKKSRVPARLPEPVSPSLPTDPRSVSLRFDGQIREGDTGYKADHTTFRLRFGTGKWKGTAIGPSIAWGDGNKGLDHWGVGSGEPTSHSEIHQDSAGDYFLFSLKGTDWESDRIAAIFRLTLPDGRPGVATASFPVEKPSEPNEGTDRE
jgi:hypothetical protein